MIQNIKPIRVGILGAASYVAGELLKMLTCHPHVKITYLVSEKFPGDKVADHHNFLRDICDVPFSFLPKKPQETDLSELRSKCDLIIMSKPHKYSIAMMKLVKNFEEIKVIDLSGDFRLKDEKLYVQYYDYKHESPELLTKFVYGLPELYRDEIAQAMWVANPGCYPTSAILGLTPLLRNGVITGEGMVINAISGASGAGKSPKDDFMYINIADNLKPYKIGVHQHTPEIEQELAFCQGRNVNVLFSPAVGSFKSGIISTMYCPLRNPKTTRKEVYGYYHEQYGDEPFIRLFGNGSDANNDYPMLSQVIGTNFCDIGFVLDERTGYCIVISCIDNTIKGAAGQAIQNLNIMCGFPEETGLPYAISIARRKNGQKIADIPLSRSGVERVATVFA